MGKTSGLGREHGSGQLTRPITVVIPVFNAYSEVEKLVQSLERTYPSPTPKLRFLFSDDASTDTRLGDFFLGGFFARTDVEVIRRRENGGFAKNINSVIRNLRARQRDDDLVLLNSDTRIYHRVFERLQNAAYLERGVATVMPLTNRGSVASLFGFPFGGALPSYLSAETLSQLAFELELGPALVAAPSGVGFCLYVRAEALLEIGLFDESFGRGYGEETDWCRRGMNLGWTHQIHPHTFVEHSGAASFGSDEWRRKEREVLAKLQGRHPELEQEFYAFVARDDLKGCRITLVLEALQRVAGLRGLSLFVLHAEPEAPTAGGTERYSRQVQDMLSEEGFGVIEMFPVNPTTLRMRGRFRGETFLDTELDASVLHDVLRLIRPYTRYLNVHHLLRWPESALPVLRDFDFDAKIFSAHDMFSSCPSYSLITFDKKCCGVEPDRAKCESCYLLIKDDEATVTSPSIDDYRSRSIDVLSTFDRVHIPSESAVPYLEKTFRNRWPSFNSKVHVLEHDLSHLFKLLDESPTPAPLSEAEENKIVFLGHLKVNKGRDLLLKSYSDIVGAGFTVEAWGCTSERWSNSVGLQITEFFGFEALDRLFKARPTGLALIPSIGPETFCFAFFESLILSPHTIPIVSPLGHPATVVEQERVGVRIRELNRESVLEACIEARRNREELLENKKTYLKKLRLTQGGYFHKYAKLWETGRNRPYPKLSASEVSRSLAPRHVPAAMAPAPDAPLNEFEELLREALRRKAAANATAPILN